MKKIATLLILSFVLVSFTMPVYADKDKGHHRERKEHSGFSFASNMLHDKDKDKHHKKDKHHDKDRKHKDHDKWKDSRRGHDHDRYRNHRSHDYRHPASPKHKHHNRDKHYARRYSKQLERMVRYAARGARNIDVWEISPDVYMLRYYLNGHYYAQRLYPSSGRYGARGLINVNWSPSPGWSLLPSININIPIN